MPAYAPCAAATEDHKELKRAAVRYARDSGLCDRENPPGTDELEAPPLLSAAIQLLSARQITPLPIDPLAPARA